MLNQDELNNIRNIGSIAHIDAGKTTTSERSLYYTGSTYKLGNVDDGNTTTDFLPQERERGITIQSAVVTAFWKGLKINIIDTPGHVDFTAEVERALRVLDGGVIILSSVEGVQAQSETVWRQADKYHVPRIVYINKYDRVGADFGKTVAAIREKLGARPALVQLPVGKEDTFAGILDVMEARKYLFTDPTGETYETVELDEREAAQVAEAREHLIEAVAEVDDEALEEYVATGTMEWSHVKPALRRATIANLVVPVFVGSSFRNKGIQPLLDGIVDYLPSPLDVKPAVGKIPGTDEKVDVMSDVNGPLVALVFKIVSDPYVGILSYIRVYSGIMRSSSYVVNANKGTSSGSAGCFGCMPTSVRMSRSLGRVISGLSLVRETSLPVLPCATKRSSFSWKPCIFPSRWFRLLLSQRPRLISRNFPRHWPSSRSRILRSESRQTKSCH